MPARVHQLNRKPETAGQRGLPKTRAESARVTAAGLVDDFNRWRTETQGGNPDLALLLLPLETIRDLVAEGWPVAPGDMGENVTTEGLRYGAFAPGRRYRLGEVEVEVSKEAEPCSNLHVLPYVGKEKCPAFVKALLGRRGWYARVLSEGTIRPGDAIEMMPD